MKSALILVVLATLTAAPAAPGKSSQSNGKGAAVRKAKPSSTKVIRHIYRPNTSVDKRVPVSLRPIIEQAGRRHKVDPRLIAAVARRESRFRTRAVSPVGARGLMQLMPRTARWLGVKDSFNARQNIFGGTKYLSMLLRQYDGNLDLTLAAYNAGPGTVKKYRGVPPYRETRAYVAAVRRDYLGSL
ncbi:MAG TPA: lytic transglycosylase domain-containing protein [Thermoanaerobaculia bacterium]|nr:lytic transglycosylase domain-containing protein [Thermoanaerobaculia bacterium]